MINIKWLIKDSQYTLESENETLVNLTNIPGKNPVFTLNNTEYIVSLKGFWNPSYYIHCNKQEVVKITHSIWVSKGIIAFQDGTNYVSKYSNKGGLSLTFWQEETELLKYSIGFENKKPILNFSIGTAIIDADKLLILSTIGMIIFSGVYNEMASGSDITTTALMSSVIASI